MIGFSLMQPGPLGGGRGWTPSVPTIPPADWRMPASVTTSAGLAGAQGALAAASADAASRGRPSVTVADVSTEWIEWTAVESGAAILSFIPSATTGSYAVTLDGADQGFTKAIPEGTNEQNRRQAILLAVTAGQAIRLTVTASGGACAIAPLLHRKPDAGPWDAMLVFGPSLLQTGYQSAAMENSILAAFPARTRSCSTMRAPPTPPRSWRRSATRRRRSSSAARAMPGAAASWSIRWRTMCRIRPRPPR